MENFISIGKVLNFHGIKGEAKVGYTLGNEDKLKKMKSVFVFQGSATTKKLEVTNIRFHKNYAIIKFKGIETVNEIVELKGKNLYVDKNCFTKVLDDDEFLFSDLKSLKAFDNNGTFLGIIEEIAQNPASNLLSIRSSKSDKLFFVPFVKDLVPKVDLENGFVVINNISGLVE